MKPHLSFILTPLAAVAVALAVAGQAAASDAVEHWYGGEYQSCSGSTIEIIGCVDGLRDRWDERLNYAYRKVLDGNSPQRRAGLRDVQRRWVAYRDANCAYYAGGEGSIARIEAAVCEYVQTRDRAQELEMMLGQ